VQERIIVQLYTHTDPSIDLAIVRVHTPFQFTATVQPVTLAPATFVDPPGNEHNHETFFVCSLLSLDVGNAWN